MPTGTILIVFGSWLALLALTIWLHVRSSGDDRDGGS
jgi:hypothetical protein